MEKRLLISLTLSFLVLYLWSFLNPPSRKNSISLSVPQSDQHPAQTGSSDFTSQNSTESDFINLQSNVDEKLSVESVDEIRTFQSGELQLTVSDRGATILNVEILGYKEILPMENIFNLEGFTNNKFRFISQDNLSIKYQFTDHTYKVDKIILLSDSDYTFTVEYQITNLTEMSKNITFKMVPYILDMSKVDIASKTLSRDKSLFEYVIETEKKTYRKNNAYKFNEKDEDDISQITNWVGFRNRYYAGIIKPLFKTNRVLLESLTDKQLKMSLHSEEINLSPHATVNFSSFVYFGPEKLNILKKYNYGLENIKRFYKFTLFDAIAKIIYEILHFIHKLIPNWGVSIIIISIIIYGSMYPLTLKSMVSMRKMQAVQPKIIAIKNKYKDNPQKLNKELMDIYKVNKINPIGGCIPVLFQMPVFIGLYQVLWRDVSFKGAGFLWIKDLSEADKLFQLPFQIPFIGNDFNLLPILMMGIMFVQTKFQAKNMTVTDPAQQAQQKMMSTIMPIFLGFIFYHFASGLTLYFTMFYIFSTISQIYISKKSL